MSDPLGTFIHQLKRPMSDPLLHGVQVGKWQGLQEALEMLESIILDNAED